MKSLLVSLGGFAALAAAPAARPPMEHSRMSVANGCFVETVAFLDHWSEAHGTESWARLLQWGAREEEEVVMGHAVAIGEFRGALWSWDINFGWSQLPVDVAERESVAVVAAPVLKKYPRVSAQYPIYRYDFPQPPGTAVPIPRAEISPAPLRDAGVVGARLSARRPVKVVKFSYGPAKDRRESAAVVFLFHGRYCIYVSEIGTVPFRVRAGVENLRVIQELLRRVLPGATISGNL